MEKKTIIELIKQDCISKLKKGEKIEAESLQNAIIDYYETIGGQKAFDKACSFCKHYRDELTKLEKKEQL